MATATDIIERLGGAAELSRKTGFPLTTIASWGEANFVPQWRQQTLLDLADAAKPKVRLRAAEFPTPDQRISRSKPATEQAAAA